MRRYVEGRWGQVHLRDDGEGPALLMLHQSPLSGAMFDAALPFLRGFRVLRPDTPGFGMSDPPPEPQSIAAHADALAALMDALELERAHVLGHHTGAMIAARLAAAHPARVERLVLNGVPWLTAAERAHFAAFEFKPVEPRPDGGHLLDAWNQRLRASPGWTDLRAMHAHVVTMLTVGERYHWGFAMALGHDMEPDLRAVSAPTLVLSNTGDDLRDATRRAAALRPDWAWAELSEGTHDIVDEQPEAWAAAVAGFLNS